MADAKEVRAELMARYLGLKPGLEDQALRLIVETGVRAVHGDEGSLLVYNPEANDLTFVLTYGNPDAEGYAQKPGFIDPIWETGVGRIAPSGATFYTGTAMPEYTGVLERVYGNGIDIVCPAGVGGGSLVYSGMMVRPSDEHFTQVFPSELTPRLMDAYYERVRSMIQASAIPDSLLAMPQWAASKQRDPERVEIP